MVDPDYPCYTPSLPVIPKVRIGVKGSPSPEVKGLLGVAFTPPNPRYDWRILEDDRDSGWLEYRHFFGRKYTSSKDF